MLVFSDSEKRMHASVLSETDACKGLFVHWYAQPERPFWWMHATDFWATDTRKLHPGRRATPMTDLTFRVEKNTFAKKKSLVSACVGQRFRSVQETPPPRDVPFWGRIQLKRTPNEQQQQTFEQNWGCCSLGVFFPRILHLEPTQKGTPP